MLTGVYETPKLEKLLIKPNQRLANNHAVYLYRETCSCSGIQTENLQ